MQAHDVDTTLRQRCFNIVCLLGNMLSIDRVCNKLVFLSRLTMLVSSVGGTGCRVGWRLFRVHFKLFVHVESEKSVITENKIQKLIEPVSVLYLSPDCVKHTAENK